MKRCCWNLWNHIIIFIYLALQNLNQDLYIFRDPWIIHSNIFIYILILKYIFLLIRKFLYIPVFSILYWIIGALLQNLWIMPPPLLLFGSNDGEASSSSSSTVMGHTHAPHNLTLPNPKKSPISHLDDLDSDEFAFVRMMFVLMVIGVAIAIWLSIKFRWVFIYFFIYILDKIKVKNSLV